MGEQAGFVLDEPQIWVPLPLEELYLYDGIFPI